MKNKFISMLLALIMVLSCFCISNAVTFTDVAGSSYEEAVSTVQGLGIIAGYPDGTFGVDKVVKRSEMAKLLVASLGYDFDVKVDTSYSDVPASHWASGSIAMAESLGIINGYGNGKFGPDDEVTYAQAVTMMVRALGYNEEYMATTYSTVKYPYNYIIVAKKLGILDNITYASYKDGLSRGKVAQLIYNALNVDIASFNKYGVNTSVAGDTILSRQDCKINAAKVIMGTESSTIDLYNLVGKYAVTYTNKNGEIVNTTVKSTGYVGHFNVDGKFVCNAATYTVAGSNVYEFLNNGYVKTELSSELYHDYGTDKVVVNGVLADGVLTIYSVCDWKATKEVEVTKSNNYNAKKFTLAGYTFANDGKVVDTKSFILVGADSVDAIPVGAVVTVYTSAGTGKISRVQVSTDTVTGIATKKAAGKYTINNVEYVSNVDLVLGTEYTCKLNYDGEIVSANIVKEQVSYQYGIYVGTYAEAFGERVLVYYDKNNLSSYVRAFTTIVPELELGKVFKYTTNAAGKINYVAQVATYSDIQYKGQLINVDGKQYLMSSELVVLGFDGVSYSLMNLSQFPVDTNLARNGEAQVMFDNAGKVVFVSVDATKTSVATNKVFAVINESGLALNAKGDVVRYFTGLVNGVDVTYLTVDTAVEIPTKTDLQVVTLVEGAVKEFEEADYKVVTVVSVEGNYVYATDGYWYVLSDKAVVYTYSNNKFVVDGTVEAGSKLYLYDTISADDIYDIVIIK